MTVSSDNSRQPQKVSPHEKGKRSVLTARIVGELCDNDLVNLAIPILLEHFQGEFVTFGLNVTIVQPSCKVAQARPYSSFLWVTPCLAQHQGTKPCQCRDDGHHGQHSHTQCQDDYSSYGQVGVGH